MAEGEDPLRLSQKGASLGESEPMKEIVVAVIGLIGTLAAALVPIWISRREGNAHVLRLKMPIYVAMTFAVGAFATAVFASISCHEVTETSLIASPVSVYFFLAISGVSSMLFGYGAKTRNKPVISLIGFSFGTLAFLLLIWWLISPWTTIRYGRQVVHQLHASCFPNDGFATLVVLITPFALFALAKKGRAAE